jgi:hypothetical protein
MVEIVTADSVTRLEASHRGQVLLGGSHGGVYAGYLAAKAGVRAVVLSDAGVGKDRAGIGSLAYLDDLGMAAATVGHMSARIGDGADFLARGVISHVNRTAAALGCAAGQSCRDCAERLRNAPVWHGTLPVYDEARFMLHGVPGEPEVWGLDSVSLIEPGDAKRIVITASHAALLGGRADDAIKVRPLAAVFNDAGVGIEEIGISRLPVLDGMGVVAATVAADSARIGDARSAWESGRVSHVNRLAGSLGAKPGLGTRDLVDLVLSLWRVTAERPSKPRR